MVKGLPHKSQLRGACRVRRVGYENQGLSAAKAARWLGHSYTRMVFRYGHLLANDDQIKIVRFAPCDSLDGPKRERFPIYN